jgi:hypothetical protein
MVGEGHLNLSTVRQCRLLGTGHSGYYYVPATESAGNLHIMQAIDKIHLEYPFKDLVGHRQLFANMVLKLARD